MCTACHCNLWPPSLPPGGVEVHCVAQALTRWSRSSSSSNTTHSRTLRPFHSLAQPVVDFNVAFCPFHLGKNKGFLCTRDSGKTRDGEPVGEEEIRVKLTVHPSTPTVASALAALTLIVNEVIHNFNFPIRGQNR